MNSIVIKVERLSKQYRLGEVGTGTISHDLNRWWAKLRGKPDPFLKIGETNDRSIKGRSEYVWALKNINFEIKKGEILGIIGKNGAGKSTLLKILSKVTGPTIGEIKAKGRIASLLEVGTGFHPELTGRENIYLNGTILGMTKAEVSKKLDEIVDFAGVERYLDTPVKRYSSGMMVRLGFSVAAHLEPEILIVDEVLAVGDAEFQAKCIGKMQDVSQKNGRTVLFVSHNMGSIKALCNRSILLDNGMISEKGSTEDIIDKYLSGKVDTKRWVKKQGNFRPGKEGVFLEGIQILDEMGSMDKQLTTESKIKILIKYELTEEMRNLRVVANILSFDGIEIFSISDFNYQENKRIRKPGKYQSWFVIPSNILNIGKHYVAIDIDIPLYKAFVLGETLSFNVMELMHNELGITIAKRPSGIIHPQLKWQIDLL